MKIGDLVKHINGTIGIGIVLKIQNHPYLPQNGQLCKVQWPYGITLVMQAFLTVIDESR